MSDRRTGRTTRMLMDVLFVIFVSLTLIHSLTVAGHMGYPEAIAWLNLAVWSLMGLCLAIHLAVRRT